MDSIVAAQPEAVASLSGAERRVLRRLSARQREVLALLALGRTNREIGRILVISPATVERHVHNILTKLGCSNRTEAAAFARSGGVDTLAATELQLTPPLVTSFVGRVLERERLSARLLDAAAGSGGIIVLAGEAGIGKTRLAEECATEARAAGFAVLWGRCYEGDWAAPYAPFAEALNGFVHDPNLRTLRNDLGFGGPPLARLAPAIRTRLPDLPEPERLGPDEEQFRIRDAMSQFLVATARRQPVLLVIDDLHWADPSTLAMLNHLARLLPAASICILGTYRDQELDRAHQLAEALPRLRRETPFESVSVSGLDEGEVQALVGGLSDRSIDPSWVAAVGLETGGNPFFIREFVLHLVEEGTSPEGGADVPLGAAIDTVGIPASVRDIIMRRVSRLGTEAGRLLATASVFNGPFRFDVVIRAAQITEADGLDAIDAALASQLIRAEGSPETYAFTHAIVRHTLYSEHNPSRLQRLHRRAAAALIEVLGAEASEHAVEISNQYRRSSALPGAETGVEWAMLAADQAEAGYAWEQLVVQLRVAETLSERNPVLHARVLARLGLALPTVEAFDEGVAVIRRAAELISQHDGNSPAAQYIADAVTAYGDTGAIASRFAIARAGMKYLSEERDETWATITGSLVEEQELQDADYPGLPGETPLRKEWDEVVDRLLKEPASKGFYGASHQNYGYQDKLLSTDTLSDESLTLREGYAQTAEAHGQMDKAARFYANLARCRLARGEMDLGAEAYRKAVELERRLTKRGAAAILLLGYVSELAIAVDEGWPSNIAAAKQILRNPRPQDLWVYASVRSLLALGLARENASPEARTWVESVLQPIERAPGWAGNYHYVTTDAAEALWLMNDPTHAEAIARNHLGKVLAGRPRASWMRDPRLTMARLRALQGRLDEARDWFATAREVLEEQGAWPLRAICDHDEALALYRNSVATGDAVEGEALIGLLDAADAQFERIGMPGWLRRSRQLRDELVRGAPLV